MRLRRALAFVLLVCLSVSLATIPMPPQLVCRWTGMPMVPQKASPTQVAPCCAMRTALTREGTAGIALDRPGCCDLRQSHHAPLPPSGMTGDITPQVAILYHELPSFIPPTVKVVDTLFRGLTGLAPRAPPYRRTPPRAPPVLS